MDETLIYNIFIFVIVPLLLTLFFGDKKTKIIFGFLVIGIAVCLLASEINNVLLGIIDKDFEYYSITISPMVEELLKAIPLIFTIFFIYDEPKFKYCISYGMAIGVGFAIFENIILYFQGGSNQTILWSLARGFGAGLMHGICGGALGFGIALIKGIKRGYFYGLFGIITSIIIYHGLFNLLVQSENDLVKYFGIALPVITVCFLLPIRHSFKNKLNND